VLKFRLLPNVIMAFVVGWDKFLYSLLVELQLVRPDQWLGFCDIKIMTTLRFSHHFATVFISHFYVTFCHQDLASDIKTKRSLDVKFH